MTAWRKLGIIAGGGELPIALAEHCAASGNAFFVARVAPYADASLAAFEGATHNLGEIGTRIEALKAAGCNAVVLVGQVPRPDFSQLKLDAGAMALLPALAAAAKRGDDELLRALVAAHADAGFQVIGADVAMRALVALAGVWGAHQPNDAHLADLKLAAAVAHAIGAFDVGQAVVAAGGLVLAVEAQEQTDAMLRRIGDLPATVRGSATARRGVLVKRPKPIQDRRIDLPVIGVRTIEGAAAAGLAGIAVEAGGALAVRRDAIVAAADAAGLFVMGFTPADIGET